MIQMSFFVPKQKMTDIHRLIKSFSSLRYLNDPYYLDNQQEYLVYIMGDAYQISEFDHMMYEIISNKEDKTIEIKPVGRMKKWFYKLSDWYSSQFK